MSGLVTRNRLIGLALAALIVIVDQAVKWYVIKVLSLREVGHVDLLSFFDFTYTENRGISLGLLEATSMESRWLLVAMTAAIAVVVLVWMMREKLLGDIAALALILGGALGNIRDRFEFGYVIDYADFHIGDFRPFLIFNIADAAITIGVVIILARSLLVRDKGATDTGDTPRGETDNA
ncbi:signal peptidase II [Porphyrobacter sp. LM 6]|uniref:signal peptidase II n=1 Tax=Porphyrobacter sp. LM 6 TaxID=1896196 RepID=UPI0008477FC6|nr:signal peptidase II [Porphyrobacter sp. LM 6]AOL93475.1 signal peptidase II [Porphyrobacter sp. LM 6]